ncbi:MAG: helix-turn-helix transcriptional regulator [Phycisphaeraceae bacterium]|nr:helix-turn-helix transcriptional regulator [Phycisphaeraceae bacterium]
MSVSHISTASSVNDTGFSRLISTLTAREAEVLDLILGGLDNREIALELIRSPKTIDKHCQRIYRKLGVNKRVNLIRLCVDFGRRPEQAPRTAAKSTAPQQDSPAVVSTEEAYPFIERLMNKGRAWDRVISIRRLSETCSGSAYIRELACQLTRAFGVHCAGISEAYPEEPTGTVLTFSVRGVVVPEIQEFSLAGTPCEQVMRRGEYLRTSGARSMFCTELSSALTNIDSYAGVRLEDRCLGVLGLLWIGDSKPMAEGQHILESLGLIAGPAARIIAAHIEGDAE